MLWIVLYAALAAANAVWMRHRSAFLQRLNDVNWDALVTLDILAGFALFNAAYLVRVLDCRPAAGETISAFTGRYAAGGRLWAEKLAAAIDALFFVLTSERDHCAKEAAKRPASTEEISG